MRNVLVTCGSIVVCLAFVFGCAPQDKPATPPSPVEAAPGTTESAPKPAVKPAAEAGKPAEKAPAEKAPAEKAPAEKEAAK
jgi:hypothetical protein